MLKNIEAITLIGLTLVSAESGALGPAKVSDLVTLTASGAQCGDSSVVRALDQRVLADGTVVPFVIPTKKALVLTGIDWRQGNTGCASCGEELFLFSYPINAGATLVDSVSPGNGKSAAGASVPISGVAIKPGHTLCFQVNSGTWGSADAVAHGYLAPDR